MPKAGSYRRALTPVLLVLLISVLLLTFLGSTWLTTSLNREPSSNTARAGAVQERHLHDVVEALGMLDATLVHAGKGLDEEQELLLDKVRLELAAPYDRSAHWRRQRLLDSMQEQHGVKTRGVLFVVGGRDLMLSALVSIRVLREHLHSTLPIQIIYYGSGEYDEAAGAAIQAYANWTKTQGPITLLDAMTVQWNMSPYQRTEVLDGFAKKVHALCFVTTLHEVLLLDSDNLPLVQPELLFELPEYRQHGNMFWPDFWSARTTRIKQSFLDMLGVTAPWSTDPNAHETESGQLLLDRVRHFAVLDWMWLLNSHSNVTYRNMQGDKDSYRVAFDLAGQVSSFYQVPFLPRHAVKLADVGYKHMGQCLAHYITLPITDDVAFRVLDANDLKWPPEQVDLTLFDSPRGCRQTEPIDSLKPDDPARCPGLYNRSTPMPLIPLHVYSNVSAAVNASLRIMAGIV